MKIIQWIFRNLFAHPDNIRLATQGPIIKKICRGEVTSPLLAIDLGCGTGRYTEYLSRKSDIVVDVDIDEKMLKRVRDKNINPFLVCASIDILPFKENLFQFALLTDVIEHSKDDKQVINETARILEKNGRILISIPLLPPPYPDSAHIRAGYSENQIIALLKDNFQIISQDYCMFKLSRVILNFVYEFVKVFRFPPPLLPVVRLEKLFQCKSSPFNLIILAKKI
ncbi:class I SAM-dependent methyltransferase [candidate division WOR-3 bacterium]|nr:class I SAM-dependent methyltransferase [candidate division WOR-3 bacterium]